jgi:hypothetical protein
LFVSCWCCCWTVEGAVVLLEEGADATTVDMVADVDFLLVLYLMFMMCKIVRVLMLCRSIS